MKLSELSSGQSALIVKIHGHGAFRKRVIEMGFVGGRQVTVLLHAPLRDPIKYSILGYEVSLRASEASLIEVEPLSKEESIVAGSVAAHSAGPSIAEEEAILQAHRRSHLINVALIGNPNCGKTTLFNIASGSKEHVGNYSGVTVDAKDGHFQYKGYKFNIVDLPGTYSLSCYSPEELYVRKYLSESTPDVIINVVDSSNLQRNLFLTTELIDMDRRMVIALNMWDELKSSGATLNYEELGRMIGVPMVPVVARTGKGLTDLLDKVIDVYNGEDETVRHIHVNLGTDLERAIRQLVDMIKSTPDIRRHFSPRYLAIKLMEGDHQIDDEMEGVQTAPARDVAWRQHVRPGASSPLLMLRDKLRGLIESIHDEDISSMVAAEKYGFIAGALAETFTPGPCKERKTTHFLDKLATNRILGFPIFFALMFLIFWLTFFLGEYPMSWIEDGVAWLSGLIQMLMPAGPLKDLIADGIVGGVGGVIVFLPNILILYFCISFMEDTGYMARAAFIMDKVMHKIGLHGKSFIPLVMGFGCNVPAILASRAIESRSSRIITILINPFMSCSARLPIYVLLIGTFFPAHAAIVFMGLYLIGIAVAVITARLLRKFLFPRDETPFVMELPPYRLPTVRASLTHTWAKGKEYLKKMGGIILFASIVVWALNYFPLSSHDKEARMMYTDENIHPETDSYLEMAGKAVNPVMRPLGFEWKATVAALAGVPAKEIVVSTLGVLYTDNEVNTDERLSERLTAINPVTHRPDFTPAVALSFMVFILLYCPCTATITAIVRETHSWKYGAFSVIYNTLVAWIVAFCVFRLALLFF